MVSCGWIVFKGSHSRAFSDGGCFPEMYLDDSKAKANAVRSCSPMLSCGDLFLGSGDNGDMLGCEWDVCLTSGCFACRQMSRTEDGDVGVANLRVVTGASSILGERCNPSVNNDDLEDLELHLSSDEEVHNKEECDNNTLQEMGGVTSEQLKTQDNCKKQDVAGKDAGGILLHACQICYKEFAQRDLLKDHVLHVHVWNATKFYCDSCSKAFDRKNDLARHINLVHAGKRKFQREFCTQNFIKTLPVLKESSHNAERPFKCAICLKGYVQKQYLMRHILTHTEENPHSCEICSRAFTHYYYLRRHLLTHTNEKRHKCEICSRAFAQNSHLKIHLLIHTGEKPYQCTICTKGFTQNSDLKRHVLIHTGEKRHKCEICSRLFSRNSHLKIHLLRHTGVKPYQCMICSKGFTQNSDVKRHLLMHTGEKSLKCEICSRAFAWKSDLKRHMMTHTGERPHRCHVCSKAFVRKRNLKSHMKSHTEK
ncbi:zinc finger protein 436-like [Hetaerina americana]|uniref:zinc finger protein 436-like n=1 Tax=Hetaerina americana TaxID=62018 RepID=UPI003A7F18B2